MTELDQRAHAPSLEVGYQRAGSMPPMAEPMPALKAAHAEQLGRALDDEAQLVRDDVAAVQIAATAHDLAEWADGRADATRGLQRIRELVKQARAALGHATDAQARARLEAAPTILAEIEALVAGCPAPPEPGRPVLRCRAALFAALPTRRLSWAEEHDVLRAVVQIFETQATHADIEAFHAIVKQQTDDELTHRFLQLSETRRRMLLRCLRDREIEEGAHARQARQRKARHEAARARRAETSSTTNHATRSDQAAVGNEGAEAHGARSVPIGSDIDVGGEQLAPAHHEGRELAARAGAGAPLPPDVRADMESALGADFSAVRVHQDGQVEAMGALAFTRGPDIHFAAGHYDPHGPSGRDLLGHELTHVAQQAQGRVPVTTQISGQAANDDPALEREADARGHQAAAAPGGAVATSTLAGPATAGPVQAKAATPAPDASAGAQPMTSEPVAATQPIQLQRDEHKSKAQHIPYKIRVTRPMTGDDFKVAAHLQMFGAVIPADWRDVKDHYTPADSPVEILVGVELFRRGRGAANAVRGIETDATGAVAGAEDRAKDFNAQPGSGERTAILAEIDRRYDAASGEAAGTKIRPGDAGRGELWRSIRDEVLFQRAYLGNLPDRVKAFIRTGIAGRELTPADYDQLFRIAKKIERLPPGEAADCASKLTASTADLDQLEATIERYRGEMAQREQAEQERTAVHNQLVGLEGVYQLYRQYLASAASQASSPAYEKSGILNRHGKGPGIGEQLEQQLQRYGFASIGEFASYVARYEQAFEDGATAITLDILARYAGKLHREAQRYQDPDVVADLHRKLAGFRAQYQELDKNSKLYSREVWNAQHERDAELRRLPGNGGMPAKPPTHTAIEAKQKAEAAKASAEAQIKNLSKEYPIFAEDELPADKRLDKVALAQAGETELAGVLQAHIAERLAVVAEARGQLEGKHELVYKMTKLMPAFYAQLGIQPGSIHDLIIQDKMHSDAIGKLVSGVLLALVAIALTVVSFGAATPAVVAAGASMGAAGLSTYMAYDEYQQYTADHAIAEAGFANDPSVVWLVLAVVGAGVDMGAATTAISKLAPVAKAFAADGELVKFHSAIEALRTQGQLDERIAAAADRAAAARASYAAARDQFKADLKLAAARAGSALGPFTDPNVYRGLVKMAVAKIREGVHSLDAFIAQLKQARIDARLAEMSPEELLKAKEAWAQAEGLAKQVNDPAKLDKLLDLDLDPSALEKFADLDVAAVQKFAALSREQLQKFARLRYADMLAKFGACDAEGLAKLATLDRAVLEKFGGWDARTIKNISGLEMPNIEQIARLKVAPGQAVEGALSSFRSEEFHMGSEVFQLDKRGMKHILERHHPLYWNGSVKVEQSFLDAHMSVEDIVDAIRAIMQQHRQELMRLGTAGRPYQVIGSYGGRTYMLGITNGRIGQFYPL